jgi:hypothetical protein
MRDLSAEDVPSTSAEGRGLSLEPSAETFDKPAASGAEVVKLSAGDSGVAVGPMGERPAGASVEVSADGRGLGRASATFGAGTAEAWSVAVEPVGSGVPVGASVMGFGMTAGATAVALAVTTEGGPEGFGPVKPSGTTTFAGGASSWAASRTGLAP